MTLCVLINLAIFATGVAAAGYLFRCPSGWSFSLILFVGGAFIAAWSLVGVYVYEGKPLGDAFLTRILPIQI